MALPAGQWRFRGQTYDWNPETYDPDEYGNSVAKSLINPKTQALLDELHGEYDTSWEEFSGPFMKEIFWHGCVYWSTLPVFVLCASYFVSCVGGPSPLFMLPVGGALLGISIAHEARLLSYEQPYYNIRDVYAPGRLAKGLDSMPVQYGFSVLRQLGHATEGLLVPQVFSCGSIVSGRYVDLWRDSMAESWAVPVFSSVGFGCLVAAIYMITVILMQGIRGWLFWRSRLDDEVGAADVEDIADWAGMASLSSAFRKLQQADIQDQAQMGAPEAILRTREGERTALRKIFHNIFTVSVPQIYISVTFTQLAFDLKSRYGQIIVTATSLMSMASAAKSAWPGANLFMDDYCRWGRLMFALTVMMCVLGVCKLGGAFACEPNLVGLLPPRCIGA